MAGGHMTFLAIWTGRGKRQKKFVRGRVLNLYGMKLELNKKTILTSAFVEACSLDTVATHDAVKENLRTDYGITILKPISPLDAEVG